MKRLLWVIFVGTSLIFTACVTDKKFSQKSPKKTPAMLSQGEKLYQNSCANCHGPTGNGKGPYAVRLNIAPSDFTKPLAQWKHTKGDPQKVFDAITNGIPDTSMAKFRYADEERWALTYAVMEFSGQKKP